MPIRRSERQREKKNQTSSNIIQKLQDVDNEESVVLPLKVVKMTGQNVSKTASSNVGGIRLFAQTSSVKKETLFQNGSLPSKAIQTSPRKVEAKEKTREIEFPKKPTDPTTTPLMVQKSLKNNKKGPQKKFSFVDNNKSTTTNGSVKSFMPIRRSERRREKKNQTSDIIQKLKEVVDNDDSVLPLKVVEFPGKNRGVVPTTKLSKGDFIVEYSGELIKHTVAKERENCYAMDISKGCYMYYFKTNGKHYW